MTVDQPFSTVAPTDVIQRLDRLESLLQLLLQRQQPQAIQQSWYGVEEAAKLLEKAEYTVREWCRLGRIHAEKRACGRGVSKEWMISAEEIERIKSQGLLPERRCQ